MDKRGQEDFITFIMSVLLYAIFFLVILVILNIPGCRNDIQRTITSGSDQNVNLLAEEQLTAYLRTQMPENLPEVVENFETSVLRKVFEKLEAGEEGTPNEFFEFFYGTFAGCNLPSTKKFLSNHPELYVEKDYAGFIDAIGPYFNSDSYDKKVVSCAFDLATKAVFVKSYSDQVSEEEYEIYYSPNIAVEYSYGGLPIETKPIGSGMDLSLAGFDFRDKGRIFSFGDKQRYVSMPASPIRIIPLNDGSLAAVQLIYFHDNERFRLPAP